MFLVFWFACFSSHKRVLGFTVSLLRKLQARSWCYGLIVTQFISAFLVLWKCTRIGSLGKCQTKQVTSYQCVLGFLIWMFLKSQSRSWFYMVWLSRKSQARSSFYGVIVAQVISAFLVLWFLLLRNSQVLSRFRMVWLWRKWQVSFWFHGLITVQVTSAFLLLWFDCNASHKLVLGFMVWLRCKSQARSSFHGLIAVQVTSAFLVLWFNCGTNDKWVLGFMVFTVAHLTSAFLGFMVWLWCKSKVRSWFYGLIVVQVTSAFLFLWFDCGASDKWVPGFMVWLMRKSLARCWCYGLIVVQVTSAFLVLWFDSGASHKYFPCFVWFHFCASNKRVLLFMVLTVAQVTSAFLFLWFGCCASDKCVPCFMVWLWRKSQVRSGFSGLIVA